MKNKAFKHFRIVCRHRHKVFKLCCKCGIPWRGFVHDLSKFSPTEFNEGVRYFVGKDSPITEARKANGYSLAWLHHKGRNKHHLDYWYDKRNAEQVNMPYKYAVESICDRIAATKIYRGKDYKSEDVLTFWSQRRSWQLTNERMKCFFDKVLTDLKDYGEKYVLNKKYLKQTYENIVENGNI